MQTQCLVHGQLRRTHVRNDLSLSILKGIGRVDVPMHSLYVSHMESEISIGFIVMANNMLGKLELKAQASVIPAIKLDLTPSTCLKTFLP